MRDAQAVSCRPDLVCFSHLRWDFVYQRPQHLLSRAAGRFRVIVFEEPVFSPVATPRLDVSHRAEGVIVAVPVLPESAGGDQSTGFVKRLMDEFLCGSPETGRVLWYYTPMALAFSRDLPAAAVVYDNMDELSAFLGAPPSLLALEQELVDRADLVFTGGMSLYAAKRTRHPSVHAFPSSIDAAHFGQARRFAGRTPIDQAAIPEPRIGFFGVIDERMDLGLVRDLVGLRPDWHFVMVGPVVKIDAATLPQAANIHWLGAKRYADLPEYLASWTAGFMPFALNEATRFISPTKTPEFLAAGLPVCSTAIKDVVVSYGERNLVEIADGAIDFASKLDLAMARPRGSWLAEVDRHLSTMSWDKTWSAMDALIKQVVQAKSPVPPFVGAHAQPAMQEAAHV